MRIGMVTGEYPPMQGGVGAFSQILSHTLHAQGHDVQVFSSGEARDDLLPLTNGVRGWGPGSLRTVRRWAQTQQREVVNLQFQTAAYQMSPFIHFLPDTLRQTTPTVVTFHDLRHPYLFPKAGGLRDWMVTRLAKQAAGVIVTNHEDYERVRHLPKAAMIPIGSNIPAALPPGYRREDWRAQAGAEPGDFLVAFFGFMNASKGVGILIQAIAALCSDGIPARLVMIGGRTGSSDPTNAAYAQKVDALIESFSLARQVRWTGFVDESEVSAYLAASDAVALPYQDGASFRRGTLMAAIQHGCPIVTTLPTLTIPEFVDGEHMLLAAPGSGVHVMTQLRRLYESPELRERLKTGARRLARHFDWQHIARDTAAFLAKAAADA